MKQARTDAIRAAGKAVMHTRAGVETPISVNARPWANPWGGPDQVSAAL